MGQNKEQIVDQLLNDATFLALDTKAFEKSILGGLKVACRANCYEATAQY